MNPFRVHDEDAIADLRAESLHAHRYMARLNQHPDCNDPAHPGCARCEDLDDRPLRLVAGQ